MRSLAIKYYRQGYNCSQCILKAISAKYNIPIQKQCLNMCQGVSNGFGVNEICSVLVAGIMGLGIIFDDNTVKHLRLQFLSTFNNKYKSLSCGSLKNKNHNCEKMIGDIAEILDEIISGVDQNKI